MELLPVDLRRARARAAAWLLSLLMLAGAAATPPPAAAVPDPAAAAASGFLLYKYPLPQPTCTGVGFNVSTVPYWGADDCGFAVFVMSEVTPTTLVTVSFAGADGAVFATRSASYDAVDEQWTFPIVPAGDWPSGRITAVVSVDGIAAGSTSFGNRMLGALLEVDAAGAPFAPGDPLAVSGDIAQLDAVADLAGALRTGVPATFSLALATPDGELRPVPGAPITAAADGTFSATVPGSVTAGITSIGDDPEITVAVVVTDATYADPASGTWSAADAGRAPVTLLVAPTRLGLDASYVSSVGWVQPGEEFPFRVFVTNATTAPATGVSVSLSAPPSVSFVGAQALPGAGSAAASNGSITWTVGSVPAATADGPTVRTLVVTARAHSLVQDPEIVWKDLSTTATLTYDGLAGAISSSTHGPKVIPPAGGFETARYGDKPFPVVPVEYVDLERQSNATYDNDAEKLDTVINDPGFVGSTFNLYQEMSFGQLFPYGTVPSAGIAAASFSEYENGFAFTTPDRTDPTVAACRGATAQEVPGAIGSPLFDTRIQDGWYQLPGTTEYYGGDFPVFTATTVAIDQACGPVGKAVYDAAQIADPEIDYNRYDSDKDGVVDFFMMVFTGCGGNGPSQIPVICQYFGNQTPWYDNIWPHSSSLEDQYADAATGLRGYISDDQLKSLDEVPQCWLDTTRSAYDDCAASGGPGVDSLPVFVRVGPYNVNPETVFQSASVISHEYGHHLGLPDFYNSNGEYYGDLNLMAADYSQHMTIFGKQELGWVVPEFLQPGETRTVTGWREIKADTGAIRWQRPDGTPYTLSSAAGDQNIHNGQAYALKLAGRQLIDPAAIPSGSHAWWSGRGNDFGCLPTGAHNLDVALPGLADVTPGTPVTVEFKSSWDIEWDYDYGFVLSSPNGVDFTSNESLAGYSTTRDFNPNQSSCLDTLNYGLTGTSGAWQQGPAVVTAARAPLANDYSHGAPFLADRYDISELAGEAGAMLRFSYATDPGFDRPAWFIDDIVVRAGDEVIYSSDFEASPEADRLTPDGWTRIDAADSNPADHAYYLELRDQSGFDFDGHGQSDRGDTTWQPGVFVEYTDEAHGYGNNGVDLPPSQHYLDSQPQPGDDCVAENNGNCADVSFTAAAGDNQFSDAVTAAQPSGRIDSFSDPNSAYGDGLWHFAYGCLDLVVTAMSGEDIGPETPVTGNLSADATITAGDGCAQFGYGAPANAAPIADAQAKPAEAFVGEPITFDASGSSDDRQAPSELTYAWDFGDGSGGSGQSLQHAYATAGTYTATVTVTDADGASDTASVDVTVRAVADLQVTSIEIVQNTGTGGANGKPKEGDKVRIRATITNAGSAPAEASSTAFVLDGTPLTGSPVATGAIGPGATASVEVTWDTRGINGDHVITVDADSGDAVAESNEANNRGTLPVSVRGNKVRNGDFEQSTADGSSPAAWTGSSTSAGSTTYGAGGADGSRAAGMQGTGGNAALAGAPTWTSAPIAVTAGETLTLQLSVTSSQATSAATAGLAYLGPAGELLNTVSLISVPLTTDGLQVLSRSVTLPPGVASVRVVLIGFAPTDLATGGTLTFDDIGLFEE